MPPGMNTSFNALKNLYPHIRLRVDMQASAFLKLLRPGNCVMAAAATYIGYAVSAGSMGFQLETGYALAAAFLVCGAGQAINDFFDKDIDAKQRPTRAIPSGQITANAARNYAILLFLAGNALAYSINATAFFIALAFSGLLILYSASLSRHKFIGNWVVAAGTAITFVFGATVTQNFTPAVHFALTALFANAARELIKDAEDLETDKGQKLTLPMLAGKWTLRVLVFTLYFLAVLLAVLYWLAGLVRGPFYIYGIGFAAAAFAASYYFFVKQRFASASRWSKHGMLLALLAFLGSVL